MREPEYINPFRMYQGAFVPNWLMERPEVAPGAKLLYGRLAQHAGRKNRCYPGQKTLARELAVSARMIRRYLRELIDIGLIEERQRGLNRSNLYYFLKHEWMEGAKRILSSEPPEVFKLESQGPSAPERNYLSGPEWTHSSAPERHRDSGQGRQPASTQGRSGVSAPISEENPLREAAKMPPHCIDDQSPAPPSPPGAGATTPPTAERAESIMALVRAGFNEGDAAQLLLRTCPTLAQVTSAIRRADRLRRAGKIMVSCRAWVAAALDRGDEPETEHVDRPTKLAEANNRERETRRRNSHIEKKVADEEDRQRDEDLGRLAPQEYEQLAEAVLSDCPEAIRRSGIRHGIWKSRLLRIAMHARIMEQKRHEPPAPEVPAA